MIPKTIHYCWFGSNKISDLGLRCIESWKQHLPDFEIKKWNESNFPINDFAFAQEAYRQEKYAFVADVARLYALQSEGGIYLDTDMELIKPIHNLLENIAFIGFEDKRLVAAGIIGSVPNGEFVNFLFDYYKNRPFSPVIQPQVVTTILNRLGLDINGETQTLENFLTVYAEDYFYPYNYYTGETCFTPNTVSLHHYEGAWLEEKYRNRYQPKQYEPKT